jgi:hypothetical protein
MPIIESKCLTELYEIRQRINQEIMDMSAEEQTAYFRRNAQATLAGHGTKGRTTETHQAGLEERRRVEVLGHGEGRESGSR